MSAADPPDPDDPIASYIDDLRHSGLGKNTVDSYEQTLDNHLRPFLESEGMEAGELTRYECRDLIEEIIAKPDVSPSTAEQYASEIRQFFGHFNARGTFDVNPMELAMENYDFGDHPEKYKREISISEMREFIRQLANPLTLVVIMILIKTGMRAGELCNLDMRDVHIDDPRVKHLFPPLRPEIEDSPDSIYIERHAEMQAGQVTNGEERVASNKRKRSTIIPIDNELKKGLVLWIAIRPESQSPAKPFLTRLTGHVDTLMGTRMSNARIHTIVTNATEEQGWWDGDNSVGMNVTPHYFRHFFTTYMRERTSDDVFVQFIRGDKGDESMDDYTHNWGDKVRTTYNQYIYKFYQ